ncbi:MAG: serine hydroxymethyltransferase [Pseudolabrys sp.]|nr:serine hydroxymethyltransferase [Pseudolabrys sp.]
MADESQSVVYFERIAIGASAKLVAVDANTGVEVTVIGPANASQADMQKLALAKLKARIAREQT